jgi:tetratricopeptide (TPR) repeat protein
MDCLTRYVYVTDAALRGMITYEMPDERLLEIEAAGANFAYTCLGAGQRSVLKEELTVRPMVGSADHTIYRHFFDRGDRRFYLLRYLADYYMENPCNEAVSVLEAMLEHKNLVKAYRMELLLSLGQIYFVAENFAQALAAYTAVDENIPGLPPRLLQIYMHTHNYNEAAQLIDRRHTQIHSVQLLEAFDTLLPLEDCREFLAAAAHHCLANGTAGEKYDLLLDVALEFFPLANVS